MSEIKIKICGIKNKDVALLIAELGAWAAGFIFVEKTPRYISPEKAADIIKALPDSIEKVGVFANMPFSKVEEIAKITGITKIQLHGTESPEFCENLKKNTGLEIIKAFRVKNEESIINLRSYKNKVDFILLDSYSETKLGGTGKVFNWKLALMAKTKGIPIILSGGLTPDNIIQAYNTVEPFALDISSGVESEKGVKSHDKIEQLFKKI
jgi:phosphoribosylanthranilate isomerase